MGYACGQGDANITTINLENVRECPTPDSYSDSTQKEIQVIQTRLYQTVVVKTCHVEVALEIKRCGSLSHTADVWNGKRRSVKFLKRAGCADLHKNEELHFSNSVIAGLTVNSSRTAWIPVVGSVENDGTCVTGTYSSGGITYRYVTVMAMVTITVKEFWAKVNVKEDMLHMPSGRKCKFQDQYCQDLLDGDALWETLPEKVCKEQDYDILYQGG